MPPKRLASSRFAWLAKWLTDFPVRWRTGHLSLINSIVARLPSKLIGVQSADYIVFGGEASREGASMFLVDENTREIQAHAMDFEFTFSSPLWKQENIAVFLDQSIGFHRDWIALGLQPSEPKETYYPMLRAAFERIEEELGLNIVIAGNPRVRYKDHDALFGARRIEYGVTGELVRASQLVIGHRSTALGIAVMFEKPVLLLGSRRMLDHWQDGPGCQCFGEALGKQHQLIDDVDKIDLSDAFDIDRERYENYMHNFVKTANSPYKPFWSIVETSISV